LRLEMGTLSEQEGSYQRIGNLYFDMQNYVAAIDYLNKSLKINLTLKKNEGVTEDYLKLAKVYYTKKEYAESKHYLSLAKEMMKKFTAVFLERDYAEMESLLFAKTNKFKESLKAYKHFILLRDSILNQDKKIAVALKEAKFEFDKKALADSLKNKEIQKAKDLQIKFQTSEIQKQKIKQYALFAGITLMLALGWLLYSRYKAVNQQRLSERKLLLLEKEQALVEERTRIADEMHDDVGADLSNLLLKIRMNERTQNVSSAVDLGGLKNSTNTIIHKIDEIIWSLNAQRDTLKELVNFIHKYHDIILK
ncbi:MAG: histidine kinase, partial [Bacteroidota bacterium]